MGQVVYADLLFFINFSMDFLCFYISSKLLHEKMKPFRMLMGAAIGALYSVVAVFGKASGALALCVDVFVCMIMCAVVTFRKGQSLWDFLRYVILYVAVSMLTGGIMTALFHGLNRLSLPLDQIALEDDISVWVFGLLAAISGSVALYSGRIWRREAEKRISDLDILYQGKQIRLRAMVDSGNLLRDPIGGKCVVVVDAKAVEPIFGPHLLPVLFGGDICRCSEMDERLLKSMRLIAASSATGEKMLCAFTPEKMTVWGENGRPYEVDALFAPTPHIAATLENCEALIPSELMP